MSGLLQRGSKGEAVEVLQRDLNRLGFEVEVDGIFGAETLDAVEQLQWMFGYTVDGKVGDGTRGLIDAQIGYGWKADQPDAIKKALRSQGKTTEKGSLAGAPPKRDLRQGHEGSDVSYLQRRLRALGWNLQVTGVYDARTEQAVRSLQQAWEYDEDGIVGPATHTLIDAQIGYGWRRQTSTGARA